MRQTLKDRRKQLQRGTPMPRLLTMGIMLAILALIFVRLRDPNTWRWFTQDNDETQVVAENVDSANAPAVNPKQSAPAAIAKPQAPMSESLSKTVAGKTPPPKDSPAPAPELTPTGPTDRDPIEQEDIQEAISAISDGNLEMTKLDMPAYFQIMSWVDHQPTALLLKRAKKDVFYSEFRKTPDSMRLQIVELNLHVLQIIRWTEPPKNGITLPTTTRDGHALYEVRGFTQESGSNLYIGIVTDLPKGMPIGTSIDVHAKLVGYFYKLQGYFSQQQQFDAERTGKTPIVLKAPLILGRLVWAGTPTAVAEEKPPLWIFAAIGCVAVVAVVGWVWLSTRKTGRRVVPAVVPGGSLDPEGPMVDHWLDQAQSGRLSLERTLETTARDEGAAQDGDLGDRLSGNIFWDSDESNNRHGSTNGSGDLGPGVHDTP